MGRELDKSSVCANENNPRTVNGPVVVRMTTSRFTGTVSTKKRSCLAAYPRTQYVPPWDSIPHPENCTFSVRYRTVPTVRYRTDRYNMKQSPTVPYGTVPVPDRWLPYSTVRYDTVRYGTAPYCVIPYRPERSGSTWVRQ